MKPLKPIISPKIYFPGLISIVLLPIIGAVYLAFYRAEYAMPVHWFDKRNEELWSKWTHQKVDFEHFRNYFIVDLSGDKKHDGAALSQLTLWADLFSKKNDFKNGVQVVLTNKTKYQDLVTVLDLGNRYSSISVVPYNDNLFLFKYQSGQPETLKEDGPTYPFWGDNVEIIIRPPYSLSQHTKDFFNTVKPFWPCLIPFVGMIYFWRKRNKWHVKADSNNYPINR